MLYDAIDSVFCALPDSSAFAPYEQLWLPLAQGKGISGERSLVVDGDSPFAVEFFTGGSSHPFGRAITRAQSEGRGLFAVALRVRDLPTTLAHLQERGIQHQPMAGKAIWLELQDRAGVNLVLLDTDEDVSHRHTELLATAEGSPLSLRRLDHIATVTPDLEEKTRFWGEQLGVPVAGEVPTPTMVIRQLKIGDAILELLGPASPESPIWQRPRGLVSVISCEVENLEEATSRARSAGFTVTDPGPGPLPGTHIATIQGSPGTPTPGTLPGMNLQLLSYR